MATDYRHIVRQGLWGNNIVLGQMLALCPLLAVTGTATNGFGMGLATTAVLIITGSLVSSLRRLIPVEVRIPIYILLIAGVVTLVDMVMNATLHALYQALGLFIPLIVTNCAILGRAEAFAAREPVHRAALDGLMMGLGFTLILVTLGAVREILGTGTLFAEASLLRGEGFSFLELTVIPDYRGFLLLMLPAGGFLTLGFLLAAKRLLEHHWQRQGTAIGSSSQPALPAHGCTLCPRTCNGTMT
ncbi:MAG: electron transport complex subunit E [Gammaproteobacteria bacterium]